MAASHAPGPVVLRIRLGAILRRLRESRGITAQQAAREIRGSDSKISRIELGRQAAREIDVSDLLTLYGVTDTAERDALLSLASQALGPPWWQPYTDVLPAWFQAYLGVEEAAESVRTYDTHFVPGLLQTTGYAAGLLASAGFGSGETAQLQQLRDAAEWPGVTIRIRPLAAGAPLSPAGFTILGFAAGELPDAVYSEQLTTASYLDRPADVARYAAAMDLLAGGSQPGDQTAAIIGAVLTRLG